MHKTLCKRPNLLAFFPHQTYLGQQSAKLFCQNLCHMLVVICMNCSCSLIALHNKDIILCCSNTKFVCVHVRTNAISLSI